MRAKRNKTLTINDDERPCLTRDITCLDQIGDDFLFDNKTINADILDVLPLMPDDYADLILIDPPYNLSKDFDTVRFTPMSDEDYEHYLRSWLGKVCSKLKPTGSLYLCGDWRSTAAIQRALQSQLTILNRITWQREKGRGAKSNWKNGMEDIWYATAGSDFTFNLDDVKLRRRVIAPYREGGKPKDWQETGAGNFRDTCPSNFWDDISIPFWSMPENTAHPTQKPEKLLAKLILASSNPGDVVFDPFAGSGSTLVTASKLGRSYVGIEISDQYCVWAQERLERAVSDRTIQGYADGVFWERNTFANQKNK